MQSSRTDQRIALMSPSSQHLLPRMQDSINHNLVNNLGATGNGHFSLETAQESGYQLNLPLGLRAGNAYRGGIRSQGHYGVGGSQPQISTDFQKYPTGQPDLNVGFPGQLASGLPRSSQPGVTQPGIQVPRHQLITPSGQMPPISQFPTGGIFQPGISQTAHRSVDVRRGVPGLIKPDDGRLTIPGQVPAYQPGIIPQAQRPFEADYRIGGTGSLGSTEEHIRGIQREITSLEAPGRQVTDREYGFGAQLPGIQVSNGRPGLTQTPQLRYPEKPQVVDESLPEQKVASHPSFTPESYHKVQIPSGYSPAVLPVRPPSPPLTSKTQAPPTVPQVLPDLLPSRSHEPGRRITDGYISPGSSWAMPSSIPGGLPHAGRELPDRGIRGTIPGQIGDFPQYYTRDDTFRSAPTSLAIPGRYRELTGVIPGDSRFAPSVVPSHIPTDARSWPPGYQKPTISDSRVPPDYVSSRLPYDSAGGYQISSRGAGMYPGTFQQTSDTAISRPDSADRLVGEDTASSQTQVQTGYEGTAAEASSAGRYRGLASQTQVQGGYSGNGSFSAQAQSGFTGGVTQSQVRGGRQGGLSGSSAQVERVGSAQSQVQVGQPSGATSSSAQGRFSGGTTQVQAQSGRTGGSAGAQAQSSGLSSSQVQVNVGGGEATQESGFQGTVSASTHGGYSSGQSQTQLQGGFDSGRTYVATAQGGFDSNLLFQGSVPQPGSIPSFPVRVGGIEGLAVPGFVSRQRESTVNDTLASISRPLEPGISRPSEIHTSRTPGAGQVGTQQGLLPPSEMFPYLPGYVPRGGTRDSYLPGRTSETDRFGVLSRPGIPVGGSSSDSIPSHLTSLQKPGLLQPAIPMTDSRQLGYLPGGIQQPTHVPSFARPEYESRISRPTSQLPTSLQPGYKLEQRPFHIPRQTQTELQPHLMQPLPPLPLQPTSKTDITQIQSRPSLSGPRPISSLPDGIQTSYPPRGIDSGGILTPGYLPDGYLPGQVPYPSHLPGMMQPGQILPPGYLPGMLQPGQILPPGYLPSVSHVDKDFQPPMQPSLLLPDFHRQPRPDLREPAGVQPGISQIPEPQISPPKPLDTDIPARQPGISQIPSLITEPQISPPKPLETYIPARLPGISQMPSLITEPQISPPKPLDADLSARPQPKRTIALPAPPTRRTIVRPSQTPGVPEPDATEEGRCCETLKNLRRRCCDRRTGTQNGSSCCSSKAGNGRPDIDIDDDFGGVSAEEPCKIVKAICYIVYKPVGKARVCKPTNTNGC
ncbi:hypothetical protein X975_10811, partial [Stegodyphus mimosarum]